MRILQIGNFRPASSTENELHRALEILAHDVTTLQEDDPGIFRVAAESVTEYDAVTWTRTGWSPPVPKDEQYAMLLAAERAGVPTIGAHLDRWWGLGREGQVHEEPFFRVSSLHTADGGHDDLWAAANVRHSWMPPGISELETVGGSYRSEWASDIAFVGSWRSYGHTEWTHRGELVRWLRDNYGERVKFWPEEGQPAVRGEALRDLYASTRVAIGDSCLVPNADGSPCRAYVSDRLPESLGRGVYFIHPRVEGVTDGGMVTEGEHLACWDLWDWEGLRVAIDIALEDDGMRTAVAKAGQEHVKATATYTHRMRAILEQVFPVKEPTPQAALFA